MKPIMIVATALILTACGGNSDPATQNDPPANTPDPTINVEENNTENAGDQVNNDETTNDDNQNSDTNTNTNSDTADVDSDSGDGENTDTTDSTDTSGTTDTSDNTDNTDNTDEDSDNDAGADNDTDTDTDTDTSDDTGTSEETDTDSENTDDNTETDDNEETDPEVAATECSAPEAGTTIVSKTTPVAVPDNPYYYTAMGPQCVVPGSQFDGPGLQYGDFLLANNAWNGQQSTADWKQCIALTSAADGSILPSWTFDWGNEDDLQPGLFEWEVKSYPEVLYGAKSSEEVSAPCAATGLPVEVKDMPDISISYNYRTQLTDARVGDQGDEANNPITVTGGDRNIALESFFHSSCDIKRGDDSNMELELMVWLEVGNERLPSGSAPQAIFTNVAGQAFDIYTKPGNDQYIAFVAQNVVQADTLNWNEFMDHARDNAATYNIRPQQDSWCLANVIFGSEIWWGEGSVNLDYYQITSRF